MFSFLTGFSQDFHPPVKNYSPKDYGKNQTPENWDITQDKRGVIYVGNANGILEFDGNNWDFINVKNGAYTVSLATDSAGSIFAGSIGDFGYLKPNKSGELVYQSLLHLIPEKDSLEFGVVWKTIATKDKVYFQTEQAIFIYDYQTIEVVKPLTSIHTAFIVNEQLYYREREFGLLKYENGESNLIKNGSFFAEYGVFGLFQEQDDLFIITSEIGLWKYNSKIDSITRVITNDSLEIENAHIIGAKKLKNGNYALNSSVSGVIEINGKGSIVKRINKACGIRVNDIKSVFEDKDNNLWLALNNGISVVNYNSPLSFFGEESGIEGNVNAIITHNNNLFIGTSNGLFINKKSNNQLKEFTQFSSNFHEQIWCFHEVNNQLFAGTSEGIISIGENVSRYANYNRPTNSLTTILNGKYIIAAGPSGVFIINTSSKAIDDALDIQIGSVTGIATNPNPSFGTDEVWIGTIDRGLIRINYSDGKFIFDLYDENDGLFAQQWIKPMYLDNQLVFGCTAGILQFIDEHQLKEQLQGNGEEIDPDFLRGYFDTKSIYDSTYTDPINEILSNNSRTWACIDGQILYFDKTDNNELVNRPFWGINYGRVNQFFQDKPSELWIGTAEGLIRYKENNSKNYKQHFYALIRDVKINSDSTIFNGSYFGNNLGFQHKQSENFIPELDYNQNTISFSYAAPYFEDNHKMLYSYRLSGPKGKGDWTEWSKETKAYFTTLGEGEYNFEVKAKNIYHVESEIASYKFTILPPWYRTTWAYILYSLIALTLIYLAVRISSYRLKKKNENLEQIVSERTAEIAQKNDVLQEQKNEIEVHQKEIMDSINYAKRIQEAILPIDAEIQDNLDEAFVLFKPKDVVSGDFYWFANVNEQNVFVCADCTGHGVPGAFMSMIGTDKLNTAVKERKITDPSDILSELNRGIKKSLKQETGGSNTKDGMDAAICTINLPNKKLVYSGANRSLWLVRNNELIEYKPTKSAVGGFTEDDQVFKKYEIDLLSGDILYMHSDGYADQFGGEKGKKLKIKTMKNFIMKNHQLPLDIQKEKLDKYIMDWMGKFEQVDDICVVGIKII